MLYITETISYSFDKKGGTFPLVLILLIVLLCLLIQFYLLINLVSELYVVLIF